MDTIVDPQQRADALALYLFSNAFCNDPACSPSRVCAMTGQYNHVNGVIGLSNTHPSMWSCEKPYTEHGEPVPPEQVYIPPYQPDTPGERAKMGRFQAAIRSRFSPN